MYFNKEKYFKYLPSKKFAIITSAVIVLAALIFVIFFMSSSGESFSITGNKNNTPLKVENQTIADLIQNDSDGDSVADWEEALWGTDKNKKITFNDMPDATYIENKKKELKIEGSVTANAAKLTETEKFAIEFFTSYNALKASGQVGSDAMNNFSSALGQRIVNPDLIDRYTEADIKIDSADTPVLRQKYYENVKSLFEKYKSEGLGDELDIISRSLAASSTSGTAGVSERYAELLAIADAYKNFAKETMEVIVPQGLIDYHLRIANNANNTGISVSNMSNIASDPLIGLSGLSQYQKYSEGLIRGVTDLENFLLFQ